MWVNGPSWAPRSCGRFPDHSGQHGLLLGSRLVPSLPEQMSVQLGNMWTVTVIDANREHLLNTQLGLAQVNPSRGCSQPHDER